MIDLGQKVLVNDGSQSVPQESCSASAGFSLPIKPKGRVLSLELAFRLGETFSLTEQSHLRSGSADCNHVIARNHVVTGLAGLPWLPARPKNRVTGRYEVTNQPCFRAGLLVPLDREWRWRSLAIVNERACREGPTRNPTVQTCGPWYQK
jgi:hypothetical protein